MKENILLWNKVLIQQPVLEHETPTLDVASYYLLSCKCGMKPHIHCQPLDKLYSSTNMALCVFLSTVINTVMVVVGGGGQTQ